MFEISENVDMGGAKIRVVGIGGAGGNAVNTMIRVGLSGVEYIVANTDAQALNSSLAPTKIQLGEEITKGLGAGANPEIGRKAALDEYEKLSEVLEGADMVFVTAGMGGGTGTGATPIIAKLAKELGALTVGVATRPFLFEGKKRIRQADKGIEELEECVDSLITIPNQKLLQLAGENLSLVETFRKADEVLLNAVQGISDLINNTGLINADFADVSTVMANKGMALMGTGICSGSDRALKAANAAINSPLLEDITIDGATGIIVNITGAHSLTTHEANEAMTLVMEAADEDAEIIFGTVIDETLNDFVKITVIATGLAGQRNKEGTPLKEQETREQIDILPKVPASEKHVVYEPVKTGEEQPLEEVKNHIKETNIIPSGPNEEKTILEEKIKESTAKRESLRAASFEPHDGPPTSRAQSIAEKLGFLHSNEEKLDTLTESKDDIKGRQFLHFNEEKLDTPSYLRKDQ